MNQQDLSNTASSPHLVSSSHAADPKIYSAANHLQRWQGFATRPWQLQLVRVRLSVCVSRRAFSCKRRVEPPPVWTAGGEHYLQSLWSPVSRASVWGTCKLPSLEYLFAKQMFLSRAITFGLHFPVAHWYRWMCIQRRPTLCMGPLGATHLSPAYVQQAREWRPGLP